MCAGVQNVSRPIEICQEMSQYPPKASKVAAAARHHTNHGMAAARVAAAERLTGCASNAAVPGIAVSIAAIPYISKAVILSLSQCAGRLERTRSGLAHRDPRNCPGKLSAQTSRLMALPTNRNGNRMIVPMAWKVAPSTLSGSSLCVVVVVVVVVVGAESGLAATVVSRVVVVVVVVGAESGLAGTVVSRVVVVVVSLWLEHPDSAAGPSSAMERTMIGSLPGFIENLSKSPESSRRAEESAGNALEASSHQRGSNSHAVEMGSILSGDMRQR